MYVWIYLAYFKPYYSFDRFFKSPRTNKKKLGWRGCFHAWLSNINPFWKLLQRAINMIYFSGTSCMKWNITPMIYIRLKQFGFIMYISKLMDYFSIMLNLNLNFLLTGFHIIIFRYWHILVILNHNQKFPLEIDKIEVFLKTLEKTLLHIKMCIVLK